VSLLLEPPAADDLAGPSEADGRATADRWIGRVPWGALLFLMGLVGGSGPLGDNSFLTHLATGRLIREGKLPRVDPYTFTAGGEPWVVQSWLASWTYASLEAVGGAGAVRLLVGLATGALVALLWRLSRPAESLVARILLVGTATVVGLSWWSERPQLLAYVLLALVAVVLAEDRPAWLLAPVFAVWVNLHGSFPLGLLLVVVWTGRRVVVRRRFRGSGSAGVAWAGAGAVVGAAVSPYGLELLTFPLHMLGRSENLRQIQEWRPPSPWATFTLVFALQVVGVAWILVRRRWWWTLLAVAAYAALAATSGRNLPVASIVLVALCAPAFAGTGTLRADTVPLATRGRVAVVLAAFVVATLVVALGRDYDLSPYPTRAIDALEERGWVATPDVRLVSHDYVGNYLEWRFGERANAWVDDRAELLPAEAIQGYVTLLSADGDHRRVLEDVDADVVVWSAKLPLARELARWEDWRIVHRDRTAVAACRRGALAGC